MPVIEQAVNQNYEAATGLKESIYVCQAQSGAGLAEAL
ncbi:galactokinase [Vibrio variabilis]|uniref:Galactokinase n=1 Tax=Vibrio variabilis TaxID=990271 RepID=A0ABQ0JI57_9VIBR|nr:galactokinase [Vibrio variabilis]